jgi:molecular chaperone HtpG
MHEQGTISIHTDNIFPIIKKALYSERDIFLRELISNSVDAITKLKMVGYGGNGSPEVKITIDRNKRQLAVADTGIGMTAEEVKRYINQVAFSSATEFAQKYSGSTDQQLIGAFGLGFYSAFMVAERVEIDTLSYQEGATPVHWSCDGSTQFTMDDGTRSTIGTTVTLTLQEDALEFLEKEEIKRIIKRYCDFLPVPILLENEVVNRQKALWRENPSSLTKDDYLEFYRYLYPYQDDPLFWIHLNTDYPFIIKGILYFPRLRPDIDPNKGQIKLFCNNVFVSENCEEVIPKFLLPLRGAIDSTDIPLNVSRSFLQGDPRVRKIQDYIAKKVGDYLKKLYEDSRDEFLGCWKDISIFMKFGSMNSDKFYQQVKDVLVYPTTLENEQTKSKVGNYTTLQDYLDRNKDRHPNRVFYTSDPIGQSQYVNLHRSQGLEVLTLDSIIDSAFIQFLEREYKDVRFSRVDAEIDDRLLDKEAKTELVDPKTNKTKSDRLKELFQRVLNKPKLTIRTEALKSPDSPPSMILLPETSRRLQEMTMLLQQTNVAFPEDHIFLINTAHPLMDYLLKLDQGSLVLPAGQSNDDTLSLLCNHIYDLAMLSQRSFDPKIMQGFLDRSVQVLTKLAK